MKPLLDFRLHLAVAAVGCITTLGMVAWLAPIRIPVIGESYLIFFIHLPSALNALGFFLLGGIFSALYLLRKQDRYDIWAQAVIAVGLLACTITLATGSTWARAAWGHWWMWDDPRLLSVAVTWFFFAGYLMLRWAVPEEDRRARFSAVFAVIACVNVPIVHYAIKVFGSVSHPMDVDLSLPVLITVRTGMGAFLLLYLLLFRLMVATEASGRTLERSRRLLYDS